MGKFLFLGLVILSGLVFTQGCFGRSHVPQPPAAVHEAAQKKFPLENPYALRIKDEVNDGHILHIAAEVKASVPLETMPAVLRLSTMKSGDPVNVTYYPVASGTNAEPVEASKVNSGQTLSYDLSASSEGITDYQLELLWGNEALEHLSRPDNQAPKLQLRNVVVQPSGCQGSAACAGKLRIMAELFNPGFVLVPSATLGIGFVWQADGTPAPDASDVPQKEQKLAINSLNLAPGKSRPVTLTVNREIPEQRGGRYRPILRIVDLEGSE